MKNEKFLADECEINTGSRNMGQAHFSGEEKPGAGTLIGLIFS